MKAQMRMCEIGNLFVVYQVFERFVLVRQVPAQNLIRKELIQ